MIVPMLGLSFIGDDVQGSWLPGYFAWEHISVWSDITKNVGNWIANEGRFFPVSYLYAEYFFSNIHLMDAEKPVQLAAVVLNVVTLYAVIRRLTSHRLAIMCALFFVMALQIRFWYDPIVAYIVLLPVALETILLAVLFWTYADRKHSVRWIVPALIIEVVGLLTYEQTYAVFIAVAVGAWILISELRWRRIVTALLCVPVLTMVVVDVILRSRVKLGAGDPYSTHLGSPTYLATVGKQLVAALPLSYWIFRPIPPAIPTIATLPSFVDTGVIVATGLALILGFYALGSVRLPAGRTAVALGLTGAGLWLFPAAVISLSPRWQAETILGLGYLNVYVEYAGVALVLTAIVPFFLHWATRYLKATLVVRSLLSVGLAFVIFVTATVNRASCAAFFPIYTAGRVNLDDSFRTGIARAIPDHSVILFSDSSYIYQIPNTKYVLFEDSGRKFSVAGPAELASGSLCRDGKWAASGCTARPDVWEYRSTVASVDQPWVQLAHVRELRRIDGTVNSIIADQWYVYGSSDAARHILDIGATRVSTGDSARGVFRYDACAGFDSLALATQTLPGVDMVSGFGAPEYDRGGEFFWSATEATLRLHVEPFSTHAHLSVHMRSLGQSVVTVTSSGYTVHAQTSPLGTRVTIPVRFGADGTDLVTFSIVGGPFHVNGDPRTLGIQFDDIRLSWQCQK